MPPCAARPREALRPSRLRLRPAGRDRGPCRRYTDGGLVATVEAVRHPEGRMTYRLETTPVWVSVPGYRILTPEAADTMTLPAAYGIFRADLDALPGNGL